MLSIHLVLVLRGANACGKKQLSRAAALDLLILTPLDKMQTKPEEKKQRRVRHIRILMQRDRPSREIMRLEPIRVDGFPLVQTQACRMVFLFGCTPVHIDTVYDTRPVG